jgi:caffeoyl-CoA O-methyltransferase
MKPIIPKPIEDYAREHSTPPSALLNELESYTRERCDNAQMLVGALEGALLRLLVGLVGARRVLEIGLFTGYSALTIAEALPDDGRIVSCEIKEANAAVARGFIARSTHGHKIDIRVGPALDTLATLKDEFDLVFMDADKESYSKYYESSLALLRRGGLIVADNVLWSGRVLAPEKASDQSLVAFNAMVRDDPRVEVAMLTVRDGVSLVRKR